MTTTRRRLLQGALALGATGALGAFVHTSRRGVVVRDVARVVPSQPHKDGAGVKLAKILGGRALPLLDPFLMLDEFKSDRPEDYVAGFPTHPHRGFETVTIMLAGEVAHADSVGNRGVIAGGGVQWMTAGRGILHSEMPGTTTSGGLLHGYQLWVNLPAAHKMTRPRYQELTASAFSAVDVDDARARVLAGRVGGARGPIDGIVTDPLVLDATLGERARLRHEVPAGHAVAVYVVEGAVGVGERRTPVGQGRLAVLAPGDVLDIVAPAPARVLVLAGRPIGEPVARRGPFVMNTAAELDQAVADHRSGRLVDG
jgi:redox-sensitive bicupin YhaK (pirin superfamily)